MKKELSGKLQAFQKEVTAITKDSENPFFHSKYFDVNKVIETIRPILNKVGLIVLQPLTSIDGRTAIKTIIVDSETGEEYSEVSPITELPKAQEMGSSITYFRRYALVSMLLLQGEQDDDGNQASQNNYPVKQVQATRAKGYEPRKAVSTVIPDTADGSPF